MEVPVPTLELLREQAALQGVAPADEDLEAVLGFLHVLLPALRELEELLDPDAPT